jgi:hypothetical protein
LCSFQICMSAAKSTCYLVWRKLEELWLFSSEKITAFLLSKNIIGCPGAACISLQIYMC